MTHAALEVVWENGADEFDLGSIKSQRTLEQRRGAAFAAIFNRIGSNNWFVDDIREVIRISLMGAGKKPEDAERLVRLHIDDQPLARHVTMAYKIMEAAIVGVIGDNDIGKKKEEAPEPGAEPEAISTTKTDG